MGNVEFWGRIRNYECVPQNSTFAYIVKTIGTPLKKSDLVTYVNPLQRILIRCNVCESVATYINPLQQINIRHKSVQLKNVERQKKSRHCQNFKSRTLLLACI